MSESSQVTTGAGEATSAVDAAPALPLQRGAGQDARPRPRSRWAATRPAYRFLHITAATVSTAVVVLALATTLGGGADDQTLTGTVALWQDGVAATGTACEGTGEFADVRAGASLRIVGDGQNLGTAALLPGRSDGSACTFGFLVPDVAKAGSYEFVVGADRVAATLSYADLRERSWNTRVSVGS